MSKYTEQAIEDMLLVDGRGIRLKSGTFIGMSHKATFIDPVYGEWTAACKKVVINKANHPTRANLNRGISNIAARKKDPSIQLRVRQACLEKYGVEFTSQIQHVKDKAKKTNLERYGVEHTLSLPSIREKGKRSRLDKYGNANYRNEDKIKKTNLEKYGAENAMSNPDIVAKSIATKENKGLITRPRGKSWNELAEELNVPRTSLQEAVRDGQTIEEYLKARDDNYSDIERIFSTATGLSKFTGSVTDDNYRPDFQLSDNTYVNVDGLYWHSQKVDRKANYHFKLRSKMEEAGYRIYQFRGDEIRCKMPIILSMININTSIKIYARKCEVVEVSYVDASAFLDKNHMMGRSNSRFYGLTYNGELVSIIGFKNKSAYLDIDRFCSKLNTVVVGGLSKLLKHTIKNTKPKKVHYWVDLRYGTGFSVEKLGFKRQRDVLSWRWTNFKETFNRLKFRANMDSRKLPQSEYASQAGCWQIFDAGQRLYSLEL